MEENTSKVLIAGDANLAAAAMLNTNGPLLVTGQGTSLFVINLCASMAPIANVAKSLPGLEAYRLYQVNRREDGRTRYRLRLGFFTSEADAEAVLNCVRDEYPTAFTACLCDEDRRFARGYMPDVASAPAPKPVASTAAPKIAVVVENKPAAKASPPRPIQSAAPQAKTSASDTVTVKALSSAKPAMTPAAKPEPKPPPPALDATAKHKRIVDPAAAKPAVVAKSESPPAAVAAPTAAAPVEIELSWDPPALQPPAGAAPPAQVIAPAFKTQDVIKAPPAAAHKPAPAVEASKIAAKPPAKKEPIAQPSKLIENIELTLEADCAPAKAPVAAAAGSEPFRVGKGVEIPKTSLTLESEPAPAAKPAPAKAPAAAPSAPPAKVAPAASLPITAQAQPAAEPSKMKAAQASAPAAIKAAVAPSTVRKVDGPPPDLDSTQTIRALTSDELKDESQEKWFAIQLAVSDQPVNLDTMPRLDIFEAYRLYSVASAGSGKITHSLRIGFFREDHSAEAVAGYLKTFFNSPSVVRISIAEQARFKDPPPPKPTAKSDAKVLDLSHARDRTPKVVPTVTMAVEPKKFDPLATGSFKANATGTHKALATGAHNALNGTGTHKALSATGTHKALKAASKSATPPTKRSQPLSKASATGRHKALQQKKSLSEALLDEAREVELSQSGIRKLPKNDSLFSKMFGKKK